MPERQNIQIEEVDRNKLCVRNLVTYVGNHYNEEGKGEIRPGLSRRRKRHTTEHVIFHLLNDNTNKGKWANEARALFFTGIKDPIGFVSTAAFKCELSGLNLYWGLLAKNKGVSQHTIDEIIISKTVK